MTAEETLGETENEEFTLIGDTTLGLLNDDSG